MSPIARGLTGNRGVSYSSTPAFVAYRHFVEDLERLIDLGYGDLSTRHGAIVAQVQALPSVSKIARRELSEEALNDVRQSLERSWGMLRTCWIPLDLDPYITEFNASVPITAYYATYHAALAAIAATSHRGNSSHRSTLNDLSSIVKRKLLPWPWSAQCTGCTALDEVDHQGFPCEVVDVNPLVRLSDEDLPHRLGSFLRTTRTKELERRFEERREEIRRVGRRNLRREEKLVMATKLLPTTIFDLLWRIRKKANYEGSDDFVVGPSSPDDARRFGASLVFVADASIMALEGLIDQAIGDGLVLDWLTTYNARSGSVECLDRHRDALSPF